jgi:hypothetical protein
MNRNFTLLILLFDALGGKIEGRKHIQKIVCISKYKYNLPFPFEFYPYFSSEAFTWFQVLIGIL